MSYMDTILLLYGCIALAIGGLYILGHSFIDAIFKRKEEMINQMIEKGEV